MTIQFPGYRIVKLVGDDEKTKVYLAEQTKLGRLVALKVLTTAEENEQPF